MKKSLRLLFVEDGEHNKPLVCGALLQAGYQLEELSVHSLAGLEYALAEGRWDLLLSDYQMPGFSCIEVIEAVKARRLDVPVIVISRNVGEEAAVAVMRAGAHDFITREHVERVVPAIERELAELEIHHEHSRMQQQLAVSEERFHQLTESIEEVCWLMEEESGRLLYVSPAFERVWERAESWLLADARHLLETLHPADYPRIQALLAERGWRGLNAEYRILTPAGNERWINTHAFPVMSETGGEPRIAMISRDVTERQRLQQEMLTMIRALEQTADAVMITNCHGVIEYVNPAFEAITGYNRREVLGRQPNILKSGFQDHRFYARIWEALKGGLPFSDIFINRRKDGELYYESKTITPVRDSQGEITHYVATGKDITERIRAEERLQHLVNYDTVTGLANRILLVDRMQQALLESRRYGGHVGVLHIEFGLAEMLGPEQDKRLYEQMVRLLAQRLRTLVGSEATLARLAPQSFVVMERLFGSVEALDRLAQAIVAGFNEEVVVSGYRAYLMPTIGISLSPEDGDEAERLLANALIAMSHARQVAHCPYLFYRNAQAERKGRLSN